MSFVKSLVTTIQQLTRSIRIVPIDRCYHFRGFRYGGFGNNLYEDYAVALSQGENKDVLRASFAENVLSCRPSTMSQMLGLDLEGIPMWAFPWSYSFGMPRKPIVDPAENPDIICHYCEKGVLASHVNREFHWLENAFANISGKGYKPETYSYIHCLELVGESSTSYLVLDGNHRVSALHATGARQIAITVSATARVSRASHYRWPRVLTGTYGIAKALQVFDRYFWPTNPAICKMNPAQLICDDAPAWKVKGS
jgi:hypothetical protein